MDENKQKDRMIKCPGCDLRLPENDHKAQKKHMEEKHPEIIKERRERPLH